MTNLIKDSLILSTIYRFVLFLQAAYRDSFTYSFFRRLSTRFNYLIKNSRFWSYFYKEDKLDKQWEKSLINRVLSFIVNIPTKIFRFIYDHMEIFLEHSYIHRFLVYLSGNFHILFGLVLVFTLIIPDHLWSNAFGLITVFGLFFIYLIKTTVNRDFNFSLDKMDLATIVLILNISLSFILSLYPRQSLKAYIFYLLAFLSLLMILNSTTRDKEIYSLVKALVFATFLTVIYAIYQWKIVGVEVDPTLTDLSLNQGATGRVFSTMGNPNVYGELLVLTMPFFLGLFLNERNPLKKSFYLAGFFLALVVLLKTGSRSAWIAFAFAMASFVFFKNKKLLPVFILLGFFMLPFLPNSIYRRLLTAFNPKDSSLSYRKKIQDVAALMLRDYWFTGVGLGSESFSIVYAGYKSAALTTVAHTHNLFLQIWLESGLLTLLSFLWLGFRLIRKTVFIIKKSENTKLINIMISSLSAIAGIVIMGFADHVWFYNRILYIFWIVVAILLVCYKLGIEEINNKKTPGL